MVILYIWLYCIYGSTVYMVILYIWLYARELRKKTAFQFDETQAELVTVFHVRHVMMNLT